MSEPMTTADRPTTVAEAVEAGALAIRNVRWNHTLPHASGGGPLWTDNDLARTCLSAVGYDDLLGEVKRLRAVGDSEVAAHETVVARLTTERDALAVTVAKVEAVANSWNEAPPRLTDLAVTRSADGDDSLTRALAIGRAYATALRTALGVTVTGTTVTEGETDE